MSKHSKGPWLMARNDCHAGGMATVHHCIGNDWIEIWTDQWYEEGNDLTEERMEANAMLMLAAPDLLEALETLKDAFIVAVGDKSPYAKYALERPLAAIAKARGEV